MPTTTRSRILATLALAAAALGATVGIGATPAGAGVAPVCQTEDPATLYVCHQYDAFDRRWATTAEVEYWAPKMPGSKTVFTATLARSAESREQTVWYYYQYLTPSAPTEADLDYWTPRVTEPQGLRKLEAALLSTRGGTVPEYVGVLYGIYLRREPTAGEVTYWSGRIAVRGRNLVASDVVQSEEARDLRVLFAYRNELGVDPDQASVDYWSERLRTGLIWLDLRIALRSATYPDVNGTCSSPVPLAEYRCLN